MTPHFLMLTFIRHLRHHSFPKMIRLRLHLPPPLPKYHQIISIKVQVSLTRTPSTPLHGRLGKDIIDEQGCPSPIPILISLVAITPSSPKSLLLPALSANPLDLAQCLTHYTGRALAPLALLQGDLEQEEEDHTKALAITSLKVPRRREIATCGNEATQRQRRTAVENGSDLKRPQSSCWLIRWDLPGG